MHQLQAMERCAFDLPRATARTSRVCGKSLQIRAADAATAGAGEVVVSCRSEVFLVHRCLHYPLQDTSETGRVVPSPWRCLESAVRPEHFPYRTPYMPSTCVRVVEEGSLAPSCRGRALVDPEDPLAYARSLRKEACWERIRSLGR